MEFRNKRPAADPAIDDVLCSPAYERTRDAYAGLDYLQSAFFGGTVDPGRIGLMGFSHGGSTALSTVISPSVQPDEWSVNYLENDGTRVSTVIDGEVIKIILRD